MARPYSMDLRERVVQAVEQEGLSRRQAAERFGVGIKDGDRPGSPISARPAPVGQANGRLPAEEDCWSAPRLAP